VRSIRGGIGKDVPTEPERLEAPTRAAFGQDDAGESSSDKVFGHFVNLAKDRSAEFRTSLQNVRSRFLLSRHAQAFQTCQGSPV
jgi:hypothetical protein